MNYEKHYKLLCQTRQQLNRQKLPASHPDYVYYEWHHIVPRHEAGGNEASNLVLLTAREHFIAHCLFAKWKRTRAAWAALACMQRAPNKSRLLNSRQFEICKKASSSANLGSNHWTTRLSFSESARKKLSIAFSGKNNPSYGKPMPRCAKLKKARTNLLATENSLDKYAPIALKNIISFNKIVCNSGREIAEFSFANGISIARIKALCNGTNMLAKGWAIARDKLLIHPTKPYNAARTPHCDEIAASAELLSADLSPEWLYKPKASNTAIKALLASYDEIIIACFKHQQDSKLLIILKDFSNYNFLVADPAYAYDCGLDIAKVLYCGDPKLYNEASAIAAARAGKKQTKPCETVHFPLFTTMWELMPNLPQALGQPAGIAYAGFPRTEHRHEQIQCLLQSNIPATLIGYSDVPARAGLTQHNRMSTNESYTELAKLGACIIAGDEEYYTLGKFAHRLHQAYALNCIAFVHDSMAEHCLNKELAELLSFGTTEELELKWAQAQYMHSEIRTLQKAWAEQCKQESLALCNEL